MEFSEVRQEFIPNSSRISSMVALYSKVGLTSYAYDDYDERG